MNAPCSCEAAQAFRLGVRARDTTGELREFLCRVLRIHATTVRVLNAKVYVFAGKQLVAVFGVPKELRQQPQSSTAPSSSTT